MAFCTKCGALLDPNSKFCVKCGAKMESSGQEARCGFCGNLVEKGLHYCSYCGADLSEIPPEKESATPATTPSKAAQSAAPSKPPEGPEQELYLRGMVTWFSGIVSPIGTLTISTHRLRFNPAKLYLISKPLELPIEQITDVCKSNTMIAIPGGMQVRTANGATYTFGFGAVNAGEADRAVQAIRQAMEQSN